MSIVFYCYGSRFGFGIFFTDLGGQPIIEKIIKSDHQSIYVFPFLRSAKIISKKILVPYHTNDRKPPHGVSTHCSSLDDHMPGPIHSMHYP